MVVTEIPARVVLHERPSDIPTCYRQTPTNIILLQTPLRVVTWKARCNYIICMVNRRTLNRFPINKERRAPRKWRKKIKSIRYYYHSTIIQSISKRLTPKVWRTYNSMDSIIISPLMKREEGERERRGREKRKKERKRKGKEGKWKTGIKTKGGEYGVCDGDDAPFLSWRAATYRRAQAALKRFTCVELLCRIASHVIA